MPEIHAFISKGCRMRNRRGLLQLEGLTERIVPAVSIRAVDGDLLITGIANTNTGAQRLWINVTADNTVEIGRAHV